LRYFLISNCDYLLRNLVKNKNRMFRGITSSLLLSMGFVAVAGLLDPLRMSGLSKSGQSEIACPACRPCDGGPEAM
jgi:hypothetical protein